MAQTPSPSNPAAELIAQLRDAKTPLARVRVVVRAWRTVRALSPRDRSNLITQLGLEGADDLVEAIAAHQGTKPPAELVQAVNQMQKLDPEELRAAASRVRDPRQRGAVIQEGLKALETKIAGPPPGPPAGFTAARPKPPVSPPPAPPPQAAPAPAPVTVMPATSWPLRAAAPQPAPAPLAAPPAPAPAPAVKAEPAPAPVAPVVVTPVPISAPSPAPVVQPAPAPEPAALPAIPAISAVRGSLAAELAAVPVLTARFRLLRRRLAAARQLSSGELRGVVEVFEDGWARRRALSEILKAGIPARTADALALVDTLESPADRAWCLGTLADSRTLSSEERATIIQAAPTSAGRRRLELRLQEA